MKSSKANPQSAPLNVGPIAEVGHIEGAPAAAANVVAADLEAQTLPRVEEQVGQVAALRIRVASSDVGKPAKGGAPALKILLLPLCVA